MDRTSSIAMCTTSAAFCPNARACQSIIVMAMGISTHNANSNMYTSNLPTLLATKNSALSPIKFNKGWAKRKADNRKTCRIF